jgi:MSHA biogenesis protein MshI
MSLSIKNNNWKHWLCSWQKKSSPLNIAVCLDDKSYSIAAIENKHQLVFSHRRVFRETHPQSIAKSLEEDVQHFNLLAQECQLILLPGQYQLILMDAMNVPESELAKALRWSLKGLSDYELDDVALDAFLVPSLDDQKKAFVTLTPLSTLNEKRHLFESAFLDITKVTIAEMAIKNLMNLILPHNEKTKDTPVIVISLYNNFRKLHLMCNGVFFLVRELTPSQQTASDEPIEMTNILFEMERSIDYCVNKLNLPEPQQLFFTPGFHRAVNFFPQIEEQLKLKVHLIDLNQHLEMSTPLSFEDQHDSFYSIAGAIHSHLIEQHV